MLLQVQKAMPLQVQGTMPLQVTMRLWFWNPVTMKETIEMAVLYLFGVIAEPGMLSYHAKRNPVMTIMKRMWNPGTMTTMRTVMEMTVMTMKRKLLKLFKL